MKQITTLFLAFATCAIAISQTSLDSIQRLDEVLLSDVKLTRYASGLKIETLTDSVLQKNKRSFTDLLRYNSNIYFKENGYGMVSSPSFRGTNASQTAVVWNGININSQLNGQTDFNLISTSNYSSISIRSGGGSVQYGSGAIGGTVHLNNVLSFDTHFDNELQLGYGSFNTKNAHYKFSYGNKNWSANFGLAYRDSDNDYKYLGSTRTNENAAFNNLDINLNLGYVLSDKDVLKVYHQNFRSDREFSATILAPSKSKYESEDYRSLLEWAHIGNTLSSSLKAVHLLEQFKYFENKDTNNFSKGQANTWQVKHRLTNTFSKQLELSIITDYSYITADGDSFNDPKRNAFSATAILSHSPTQNLQYNLNVRQDVISDFKSPFVFSGDVSYQLASFYTLKFNASKNFRVPTFNDLYWNPGGNLDLKPEDSCQLDLGHEFKYHTIGLKLNTFYIKTSNLIQWRPNQFSGYWNPMNIANAKQYGLEAELALERQIGKHRFDFNLNYSYTKTEDLAKNQALFYVPIHMANAALAYSHKDFSTYYQHLYNGAVKIIGGSLKGFDVGNLGFGYRFKTKSKLSYQADFSIDNLYNTYYENVALRPMPNRNFNLKLTLNF
ncbi:TonB-dependent receptor [Subsaximicrobium wynnwilliamsii]|uniref:TonB-dependent receptor n=1 Tax=Subsaximicrobium wynnwilliamsii TaxID=291179 RepID=A0A5C6ZJ92_9FLAO|nr:TonB-dependent receptor [Subsaximicrobium wynnwilliamsii]TXD84698.1 TonB-dependent receptor [Subsaximicrobium wynnwilliamsii]TXD90368.1 TonB-dependent receptor [Subsaximicrobium wynnwilliamsii]TXE04844.1 TonB-dependent receptor [Subsaximicrobium wynnwilliamsii]